MIIESWESFLLEAVVRDNSDEANLDPLFDRLTAEVFSGHLLQSIGGCLSYILILIL